MQVKRKYLGLLYKFCEWKKPSRTTGKVLMQMATFAKAVRDQVEQLNEVELTIGKRFIPDFDGTFNPTQQKELKEFEKEIKSVYEEEIELPEAHKFSLTMWENFPGSSFELADLIDLELMEE